MDWWNLHQWEFPEYFKAITVGAVYSLLPDLDAPSSKASKIVLATIAVTAAAYVLLGSDALLIVPASGLALLSLIWLTKHRGVMHTPIAAVVLSLPLALVSPYYAAAAFFGYCTHLLLDGRL
ncbi:MAG: metal-dependent hydrolase [Candidatus Altiarchaeota archaeon]